MKFNPFFKGVILITLAAAVWGGCAWVGTYTSTGGAVDGDTGKKVIVFFLIVNQTGKDVLVKATADGRELFVQGVGSKIKEHPGEVPPPSGKYPAKELKVVIATLARSIEVQETYSKIKAIYDITDFGKRSGGFRITVKDSGISLKQDYFPIH